MIKTLLAIIVLTLPISSQADVLMGAFDLNLGGGVRLGRGESSSKISVPYVGVKVSHTEVKFSGNNVLSLFPIGVNYDTDWVFSVSISPIMIVVPNRISLALDYFLPSQHKTNVGSLGLFIGFPFGN
jgi:hypothetical protein